MNHEIRIIRETLKAFDEGSYESAHGSVMTKLQGDDLYEAEVFLPEDIEHLKEREIRITPLTSACVYRTKNIDSFQKARELIDEDPKQKVLVLNLANPVNPGGGVRRGAHAQEEDLCRKSSLLLNLEGPKARPYYDYNRSLHTNMGSDAIIISDRIEVIRGPHDRLLDESWLVSVMTCAAPYLRYGLEGMSEEQYYEMLVRRIRGMIRVAAYKGYTRLVLGAFGCGAFRNDAKTVAKAFDQVFGSFSFHGYNMDQLFESVDFAVLCTHDLYNYEMFSSYFKGE